MEFIENIPPREFTVGTTKKLTLRDLGKINLKPNEQVSFTTESGKEHDFVRKNWGFYATPSINGRLLAQGFKTALVRNLGGRIYIMVVDDSKMEEFLSYIFDTKQDVIEWLDEYPLKERDK